MNSLEVVINRELAISLMKCILEMQLPGTFWLENLLSLRHDFQSHRLFISIIRLCQTTRTDWQWTRMVFCRRMYTHHILSVSSVTAMTGSNEWKPS